MLITMRRARRRESSRVEAGDGHSGRRPTRRRRKHDSNVTCCAWQGAGPRATPSSTSTVTTEARSSAMVRGRVVAGVARGILRVSPLR